MSAPDSVWEAMTGQALRHAPRDYSRHPFHDGAPEKKRCRRKKKGPSAGQRFLLLPEGYFCAYCGSTRKLDTDHVDARAVGGSNEMDNRLRSCRNCNDRKGMRSLVVFLAQDRQWLATRRRDVERTRLMMEHAKTLPRW